MPNHHICKAKLAVGGGKKARRRGRGAAKWFCYSCVISSWFAQNLRDMCNEANGKTDAGNSTPDVIDRGNAP